MKFLDLDREYNYFDWKKALEPVFEAKSFINGPQVKKFEEAISKQFIGSKHAIGVSSGTDALQVALMALDIKDKVVLTTPYTFIATTEMPIRLGAKIVFCDIDDDFNMDMNQAKEIIRTKKIDVLLLVHLFGLPCLIDDELLALCKKNNVKIVEDCAQALGSSIDFSTGKKYVGNIGDIGCFSFFPAKNLGCAGDGGLVSTNSDELAEKCRMIRNHGSKIKYHNEVHGGNFRLDSIQAALMLAKLPFLSDFISIRQKNAEYFNTFLTNRVKVPLSYCNFGHTYCQYVIQVDGDKTDRDDLQIWLKEDKIPTMIYYPMCLSEQECYKKIDFESNCKNSISLTKKNLALPIAFLTESEREQVVNRVNSYYE